jgi:hypothetical protein
MVLKVTFLCFSMLMAEALKFSPQVRFRTFMSYVSIDFLAFYSQIIEVC